MAPLLEDELVHTAGYCIPAVGFITDRGAISIWATLVRRMQEKLP